MAEPTSADQGVDDGIRKALGLLIPAIRLPADYARVEYFCQLARDGVAGFLVFGGDEELVPPFLRTIREAACSGGPPRPILIMTDAERGVGQQIQGCAELPPLLAVGATLSEERAYQHGRATALEARAMGINMVLAPVVDVLSLPSNPIVGNRSFGSSPDLVARLSVAWIAGAQDQGVLACAKHFPGHGHTEGDSHAELPSVDADLDTLRRRELPPFRAAIAAGVGAVMTAHVRYPALDPVQPATLSSRILRDLLRGELGFGGLVLSDALIMDGLLLADAAAGDALPQKLDEGEAAVRCAAAGCDLLLYPTDAYEVAAALSRANAAHRIELDHVLARVRLSLSDLVTGGQDAGTLRAEHLYSAYSLARDSLTVLANNARLLPLGGPRKRRVLAILVDDDDAPVRERAFRDHAADLAAGFVRVTSWRGTADERLLLGAVDESEVVFLGVACSIRAWKGRAGLAAGLLVLVAEILARAPAKTVTVLFTAPGAIEGLPVEPVTLVGAWGDADVTLRAALDVILSGSPIRGLDPTLGA